MQGARGAEQSGTGHNIVGTSAFTGHNVAVAWNRSHTGTHWKSHWNSLELTRAHWNPLELKQNSKELTRAQKKSINGLLLLKKANVLSFLLTQIKELEAPRVPWPGRLKQKIIIT